MTAVGTLEFSRCLDLISLGKPTCQDLVKKVAAQVATLEGELQGCQQMLNNLESKLPAKEEVDGQEANKDKLDKDLDMLETQSNDRSRTLNPGEILDAEQVE